MHSNTKRFLTLSLAGLFFCGMAFAQQSSAPTTQQPPASKPATTTPKSTAAVAKTGSTTAKTAVTLTLKTDKEKASYAIGLNIGKSMKKDAVEVDPDIVARGIKDAISGKKPLLTDEEAQTSLTNLSNEVKKRQQGQYQEAVQKNKADGDAFLTANKAKPGVVVLPSGLQYKIIQPGDGPKPTAADTVVCNYRGMLVDGTEFDSSYKRGQPATFPVGQVIKGWTEALQLMPVGSKWELYIPPTLGYGERGTGQNGPIGPNETLIFQVELVSIQPKAAAPAAGAQPQAQPQGQPQSQAQPQQQPQAAKPQK